MPSPSPQPQPQPQPIEALRNLGPESGHWLRASGIRTIRDLETLGPVAAFALTKRQWPKASFNLLWALAAGLEDKDWRELAQETKDRLKREWEDER